MVRRQNKRKYSKQLRHGAVNLVLNAKRPERWDGCRLFCRPVELWTARSGQLNDRAVWMRTNGTLVKVGRPARRVASRA